MDVSLEIPEGCCTVIGGENGSGKSVLMSILAGLEEADSGKVELKEQAGGSGARGTVLLESTGTDLAAQGTTGTDLAVHKPKKLANSVGLVFQEAETQILGETPREDIAFGPKNLGWKKVQIEEAVTMALEKTGLTAKAEFPARFLSGGEKRRLAVACMISMNLPIIIMDEPYANLDFGGVKQVNALISQLKAEGKTIIILTHEIEKCLGLAQKFIVLFRGKKVFEGTPEEGLKQNLEQWNIRNPLVSYKSVGDLIW